MATIKARSEVPGSRRESLHDATRVGPVPNDERFEVTVRIRCRAELRDTPATSFRAAVKPGARTYMNRDAYAAAHGADPQDIDKVERFAREHGLVVVEASAARRSVFLSGTAAAFAAAFGTEISHFEHEGGTYRGRTGALTVPSDLKDIVEGVFGIDDRPIAKPHFQRYRPPPSIGIRAHAVAHSFTPPELAKLYNFPAGASGDGQCIAIIELGGGYRTADIKAYFQKLGLAAPKVTTVRVDGGRNQPSSPDSADGEVMLDIEVAAAVAPHAKIAVYFAPNTDKGFLDAITLAIHDKVNKPSVVSISWGSAEKNWTGQAMRTYDQAFQAAAALGVTVCAAAGDNGSTDGETDGASHVDFPSSSPFVLGCGGTKLTGTGSKISSETVWNEAPDSATGGGVSGFFDVPAYQDGVQVHPAQGVTKPGRGVPDVAGDADPATGYVVRVDGQESVIGGTSAVAPLWAGLVALMNEKLGKPVGFLNPLLYGPLAHSGGLHDIRSGSNGAYAARQGWDACTGWGSPNGAKLLAALEA